MNEHSSFNGHHDFNEHSGFNEHSSFKAWQPQGFEGLQVLNAVNVIQSIPTLVCQSYELCTLFSGSGTAIHDGKKRRFTVPSPFQTFTNPGVVASYEMEDSSFFKLGLEPDLMASLLDLPTERERLLFFPALQRMTFDGAEEAHLATLLPSVMEKFMSPASLLEQQSVLLEFVNCTVRLCAENPPPRARIASEHRAVKLVRDHLRDAYASDPDLADLAALTGLNKYHLIQVFKRAMGVSPHQYLIGYRVHRAKALLGSGQPIVQVALETGFVDQAHFSRTFKRYTMITPGQFQKESLES
jgi:AraC-like DNA-binding protein